MILRYSEARLPTPHGEFRVVVYRTGMPAGPGGSAVGVGPEEHVAMVMGDIRGGGVLTRVHSSCFTGEVLGSLRCDCRAQLDAALERIGREGRGVVVYLVQEGRGIGLGNKVRAYHLQDDGADTVDANLALGLPVDNREYGIGAQILVDLGITTMRLLTNNPAKYGGLEGYGLEIVERVGLQSTPNPENIAYLRTKQRRLGHLLEGLE
jgi:3,4-dihydroxy 2-butanone 4-phosphate synthase/GTP cyclohydrolase II